MWAVICGFKVDRRSRSLDRVGGVRVVAFETRERVSVL